MKEDIILFGTGDSAKMFMKTFSDDFNVLAVADNFSTGLFEGREICRFSDIADMAYERVVIASSAVDQILPQIAATLGALDAVYWYDHRSDGLVPANRFVLLEDRAVLLSWKMHESVFESALSAFMVEPDAYKKLLQGVAYIFSSAVEGDVAEFGTCSGNTASLLAHSLTFFEKTFQHSEKAHKIMPRQLHLFDSFEGFPKAACQEDLSAPHVSSGVWGEGTAKGLDAPSLRQLCRQFIENERIDIYEGWYKDTLSDIDAATKFALIHIDCDLYESTVDVLNYLFANNHISDGCTLFFDNWNSNRASPKFGERKAWADAVETHGITYSDCGEYGYNSRKFIVHLETD